MEPVIKDEIACYKQESGDMNIEYMHMPDTTPLTVGAHSHPGFAGHMEAAKLLGKYLGEKFDTPFDDNIVL